MGREARRGHLPGLATVHRLQQASRWKQGCGAKSHETAIHLPVGPNASDDFLSDVAPLRRTDGPGKIAFGDEPSVIEIETPLGPAGLPGEDTPGILSGEPVVCFLEESRGDRDGAVGWNEDAPTFLAGLGPRGNHHIHSGAPTAQMVIGRKFRNEVPLDAGRQDIVRGRAREMEEKRRCRHVDQFTVVEHRERGEGVKGWLQALDGEFHQHTVRRQAADDHGSLEARLPVELKSESSRSVVESKNVLGRLAVEELGRGATADLHEPSLVEKVQDGGPPSCERFRGGIGGLRRRKAANGSGGLVSGIHRVGWLLRLSRVHGRGYHGGIMSGNPTLYLDNCATTPVDPRVLEAMLPYLRGQFGNPSSKHAYGFEAAEAVEEARDDAARLIHARGDEIVWTSGATESTNLALKGLFAAATGKRNGLVTVATEHKATLDVAKWLGRQGAQVTVLPVDEAGLVDLNRLAEAVTDKTLVVSVMGVNNETGVIQDLEAIGRIAAESGAYFHCDAAQAFGKMSLDVDAFGIDLMSVSGHKIYAPKGVGFLYVRGREKKTAVAELIHGGGHEGGRRSGTLNVPGIVALGKAAQLAREELKDEQVRLRRMRDALHARLENELDGVLLNGSPACRVSGTLNISLSGTDAQSVMMACPRLAVSAGSACNAQSVEPSYVLKAMGYSTSRALSALRFGLGRFNTDEEVEQAATWVVDAVRAMRARRG